MGRILAIDFGTKRTGLAWTDVLRISINPLDAVTPDEAINFIEAHQNEIDTIVLGMPLDSQGYATNATESVVNFGNRIQNKFPQIELVQVDESYTSREAMEYMINFGYKRKDRRTRENLDKVAAAIILQRYLDMIP